MDVERLNRAIELRDTNQVEAALKEFRELEASTADRGERASLLLNQSGVLAQMGAFDEAEQKLREAVTLCPTPEVGCHGLVARAGNLTLGRRWAAALAELDRATTEFPDLIRCDQYRYLYEEIQTRRGLILVQLNRLEEALVVLKECLSFDLHADSRWKVLYNLGRCHFNLKDPARAKQKFLEFLKVGGDAAHVASAHFLLGTIYYNEGADAKALMEFEWLLPRMAEVKWPGSVLYTWLAKTHRMLGNKAEAKRYAALAEKSAD
jgi:tetratricopeptide (TPR) repeat protein